MTAEPADSGVRLRSARGRWIVAATVLGSSLAMLDSTVVNIALPSIADEFGAGVQALQWTVSGYTLTLAAFVLLGGALGDRFGRRRIFVIGTVWFTVASILCAAAPTVTVLIVARVLQGVGAALLTPGSLALISASIHPDDRGAAIGMWSGLGGVAAAIGPLLGGWLVDVAGWRSAFWINVPLAVAVVVVATRHVPESLDPRAPRRPDVVGSVVAAAALAAVTYGAIESRWIPVAVGALLLIAFVVVLRRSSHPLIPTQLFVSRVFVAANLVTFVVYAAIGAVFFLLVLQLQIAVGWSPLQAGTATLPLTVLMLVLSARAGALAGRIGPRLPMTVGPLVAATGLLAMMRIGPGATYFGDVLPAVVLFGLGLSALVAPLTTAVLGAAPTEHAGSASAVNNAVARTSQLLAVSALPALVGIGGADYTLPDVLSAGFDTAMTMCAGLLIAGALLSAVLVPGGTTTRSSREPATEPTPETATPMAPPTAATASFSVTPRSRPAAHCDIGGPPMSPPAGREPG